MSSPSPLGSLLRLRGLRVLLAARWTSQAADGVFQAGLAWLVLLAPDRQQSPAAIAGAAALILLPFSVVGPFAGVLLDRWSRRSVLVFGQLVRVALLLALAVLGDSAGLTPVYAMAIAVLGVNRFLMAAFSASLPSVVPRAMLLPANALAPTAGTAWVVVGFGLGGVLLRLTGGADPVGAEGTGPVLLLAAAGMALAGCLALRLAAGSLGPQRRITDGQVLNDLRAVVSGLVAGLRHLAERREAGSALLMLGVHRFCFGLWTLQTLLEALARDAGAGLSATAVVAGCGAGGYVSAAVVTPLVRRRMSDTTWVCGVLVGSAVVTVGAAATPGIAALSVAAALLGLGAQSIKICVDTAVQRGVDDHYLGRGFAIYDVVFNVAFVSAAVASIALLPSEGRSAEASTLVAFGFVATAAFYRRRRKHQGALA